MKKINHLLLLSTALVTLPLCSCTNNKSNDGKTILQIAVVAKGYGYDFVNSLIEEFNKRSETVRAELVYKGPNANYQDTRLQLQNNQVDLFFTVQNTVFKTQTTSSLKHWADLTDVYDSPLEGYEEADGVKTIRDYIDPSYVDALTFTDGKLYSIPYTSGVVGLLYNKSKWDSTNANLRNKGKEELTLPKTTNEMFELFERIKTTDVKNASGGAYAFSYSGINSYMHFMFNGLWPQYLGKTAANNFFEGKNENGIYTADIYKTDARKYAYSVVREMILQQNGYVSSTNIGTTYDLEQLSFLRGNSLFSCNGDWMEREASTQFNPGEADVELIRTPILSEIVNSPSISSDFTGNADRKEAKLQKIISFIDENYINNDKTPTDADAESQSVTLNTLNFLYEARLARHNLADFMAVIPENSKEIGEAKDFLRFMLSKDGQELMMSASYGCSAPMTIDYKQMEYYEYGTYYSKSRLDLIKKSISYGNYMNTPMEFLAGLQPCKDLEIASAFGGKNPSTAEELMMKEYNEYNVQWDTKMQLAGVSN